MPSPGRAPAPQRVPRLTHQPPVGSRETCHERTGAPSPRVLRVPTVCARGLASRNSVCSFRRQIPRRAEFRRLLGLHGNLARGTPSRMTAPRRRARRAARARATARSSFSSRRCASGSSRDGGEGAGPPRDVADVSDGDFKERDVGYLPGSGASARWPERDVRRGDAPMRLEGSSSHKRWRARALDRHGRRAMRRARDACDRTRHETPVASGRSAGRCKNDRGGAPFATRRVGSRAPSPRSATRTAYTAWTSTGSTRATRRSG